MDLLGIENVTFREVNRVFPLRRFLLYQLPVIPVAVLFLFPWVALVGWTVAYAAVFYPMCAVIAYWMAGMGHLRQDRKRRQQP